VVRLQTRRRERPVLAPDGRILALLAQDQVTATTPAGAGVAKASSPITQWSELEVELAEGDRDLLREIGIRMGTSGAVAASSPSKLARALQDRAPQPRTSSSPPTGSAGAILLAHLTAQVRRLESNDPLVRADAPDAVHQMRVASRRLRSTLTTFRPLFDRALTEPLRDQLQWLGTVLGAARDAEVIRDHLIALVTAEPPDLVLGPVRERIVTTLTDRYRAAHDGVLAELDSERYFALLDDLDRLVTDLPLLASAVDRAGKPDKADKLLLPLVGKSWKTLERLHRTLEEQADPIRRDLALHDLRKAAKRARYAGEALTSHYGDDAARWATAMEAVQEILGAHQDTVVIRDQLRLLATQAHAAGEDTFSYGRLHALEQARADSTAQQFTPIWERAADPALRRWLDHRGGRA
jgi:CHAD domain-containing protein